jgi:hypothetical protein
MNLSGLHFRLRVNRGFCDFGERLIGHPFLLHRFVEKRCSVI